MNVLRRVAELRGVLERRDAEDIVRIIAPQALRCPAGCAVEPTVGEVDGHGEASRWRIPELALVNMADNTVRDWGFGSPAKTGTSAPGAQLHLVKNIGHGSIRHSGSIGLWRVSRQRVITIQLDPSKSDAWSLENEICALAVLFRADREVQHVAKDDIAFAIPSAEMRLCLQVERLLLC